MIRLVSASLVLCALAVSAIAFTVRPSTPSAAPIVSVGVDLRAARQRIDGFGSSERVWGDPHLADAPRVTVPASAQARIMALLYRTIGLTGAERPRPGRAEATRRSVRVRGQARRRPHCVREAGTPLRVADVLPGTRLPRALDDGVLIIARDVDWAMAMLRHWRSLGVEPRLYAPLNEARVAGDFDPVWMHEVVLGLGRALKAEGFDTKLVIPDDENPVDAYRRAVAVLSDPEARSYLGALAYHVYRWGSWSLDDLTRMRALATRHKLPLWMTEYASGSYSGWDASLDWASKMHVLLTTGGVNAIDYLWGFFGEKYGTDALVSIAFEDGVYRGHSLTPVGAIMGQYARFVRPGSIRVDATSSTDQIAVTAYREGRRLVVVVTNPGSTGRVVRVAVKGGAPRGPVRQVRSSATERLRGLPPLRSQRNGFSATLAARSVTTFIVPALAGRRPFEAPILLARTRRRDTTVRARPHVRAATNEPTDSTTWSTIASSMPGYTPIQNDRSITVSVFGSSPTIRYSTSW